MNNKDPFATPEPFRKRLRRACKVILPLILVYMAICFVAGILPQQLGFTDEQAADQSKTLPTDSIMIAKLGFGNRGVLLYENELQYNTLSVRKFGPFWALDRSSYWVPKLEDPVKLVGWMSQNDGESGITVIPVRNDDERVAYIEIGPAPDRKRLDMPVGEIQIFAWDRKIRWNDLDGIACSADGTPLYRLGYELIDGNRISTTLRWLPEGSVMMPREDGRGGVEVPNR